MSKNQFTILISLLVVLALLIVGGVVLLPRMLDRAQEKRDDGATCIGYRLELETARLAFKNAEGMDQIIAFKQTEIDQHLARIEIAKNDNQPALVKRYEEKLQSAKKSKQAEVNRKMETKKIGNEAYRSAIKAWEEGRCTKVH